MIAVTDPRRHEMRDASTPADLAGQVGRLVGILVAVVLLLPTILWLCNAVGGVLELLGSGS
jgi:hypothetical protein